MLVLCVREVEGKHTISMTAKDDDAVDSLGSSSAKEQSERKGLGIHGESKDEYYRLWSMGHTQKHQPMARWMGRRATYLCLDTTLYPSSNPKALTNDYLL